MPNVTTIICCMSCLIYIILIGDHLYNYMYIHTYIYIYYIYIYVHIYIYTYIYISYIYVICLWPGAVPLFYILPSQSSVSRLRSTELPEDWCWMSCWPFWAPEPQAEAIAMQYIPKCTPTCSMYGIFTYIWAILGVNVGKYSSTMEHVGVPQHAYLKSYDSMVNGESSCRLTFEVLSSKIVVFGMSWPTDMTWILNSIGRIDRLWWIKSISGSQFWVTISLNEIECVFFAEMGLNMAWYLNVVWKVVTSWTTSYEIWDRVVAQLLTTYETDLHDSTRNLS